MVQMGLFISPSGELVTEADIIVDMLLGIAEEKKNCEHTKNNDHVWIYDSTESRPTVRHFFKGQDCTCCYSKTQEELTSAEIELMNKPQKIEIEEPEMKCCVGCGRDVWDNDICGHCEKGGTHINETLDRKQSRRHENAEEGNSIYEYDRV